MLKNKTVKFFIISTFLLGLKVPAQAQEMALQMPNATANEASSGQYTYDAQGRRNPFLPLVTRDGRILKIELEGEDKDLALEGIIYDKSGLSFAMVNGQAVKIGDSINDYQVLKIGPDRVVFIKDGETLDLVLKKEE